MCWLEKSGESQIDRCDTHFSVLSSLSVQRWTGFILRQGRELWSSHYFEFLAHVLFNFQPFSSLYSYFISGSESNLSAPISKSVDRSGSPDRVSRLTFDPPGKLYLNVRTSWEEQNIPSVWWMSFLPFVSSLKPMDCLMQHKWMNDALYSALLCIVVHPNTQKVGGGLSSNMARVSNPRVPIWSELYVFSGSQSALFIGPSGNKDLFKGT